VTPKDLILAIIAQIGTGGGQGYVVEYRGPAVRALSMEGRLTVCNMSIEAGARAGLVAPDDVTFSYLEGRPHAPSGADWERALDYWRSLPGDADAAFDHEVTLDAGSLTPYVTWGTNPGQALPLASSVPDPGSFADPDERSASTSNRNFEGRQGKGGRTHLVSPAVAAATAVTGHLAAPADL